MKCYVDTGKGLCLRMAFPETRSLCGEHYKDAYDAGRRRFATKEKGIAPSKFRAVLQRQRGYLPRLVDAMFDGYDAEWEGLEADRVQVAVELGQLKQKIIDA